MTLRFHSALQDSSNAIDNGFKSYSPSHIRIYSSEFFKFFPGTAVDAHLDLCEAEELGLRVQAIRGLPLFCKDTPEHISKIVDILAQLLIAEENVERDAVHKALLSLLRQDVKASLTALFKHIESVDEPIADDNIVRGP